MASHFRPAPGGIEYRANGVTIKIGNITSELRPFGPAGGIVNGVFIMAQESPHSAFSVDYVMARFYANFGYNNISYPRW